jgi:hypothetical protein
MAFHQVSVPPPNCPASMVIDSGSFVAAIERLGMETRFLEFARSPELSGSRMSEDRAITTCGLQIYLAPLFVLKAHYNVWTLAIAQGQSWLAEQLTGEELLT